MATAGYSGTPLERKLGFKPGMTAAFLDAPGGLLADLEGVTVKRSLRGPADIVLCFVTARRDLERRAARLRTTIAPDGMVWVCWPKKAAQKALGIASDLDENRVRDLGLELGFVDVKVAAVDETWSGLKLVVRKELR